MKTILTTLNAKYIHKSLALRLLYVSCMEAHDIDFIEYTIKDDINEIARSLLATNADVIGISCYIWNVTQIKKLTKQLKEARPDLILILGGPEVSYEPVYFLEQFPIDYVISGEGEISLENLLTALETGNEINIPGISYAGHIAKEVPQVPLSYVESLPSPYLLERDLQDMGKRILYFETSRGCPYQCQYCLSSLEKGLRFFSLPYLYKQLDGLFQSGVKTIKVLDRSFNANVEHALAILNYLFKHAPKGVQVQFEINADVFPEILVNFINEHAPEHLLRFEVGIQSISEKTNEAVGRHQNFKRLSEVVKALLDGGKCDLHLDLIAGLPFEDLNGFQASFDKVFAFRAKELQLGFLKLLRGTSLRRDAEVFGYRYQMQAPYELAASKWLSEDDIAAIHLAEEMLERYWNSGRFVLTMNRIMNDVESPFAFFYQFGTYYVEHGFLMHGYQLFELFGYLDIYTNYHYHDELVLDYLKQCKTKSKRWYEATLDNVQRHQIIEYLSETYHLNRDVLYRYAMIEKLSDRYAVAIYRNMTCDLTCYPLMKEGTI